MIEYISKDGTVRKLNLKEFTGLIKILKIQKQRDKDKRLLQNYTKKWN